MTEESKDLRLGPRCTFLFVLVVAVICLVRFIFYYVRSQYLPDLPISDDTAEYLDPAAAIFDFGFFSDPASSALIRRLPGYPLVIAGLFELFGRNNFLAIIILQNISFFVCAMIVARLAWLIGGQLAMIITTLLYLTDFTTFFYTNTILSESLFGLMLCISVFLIVQAFRQLPTSYSILFFAGVAITLATYIRIASVYLIPTVAILVAVFSYQRNRNWHSMALSSISIVAPWILFGGIWFIRNYFILDRLVFSSEQTELFFHRSLHMISAIENISKGDAQALAQKYLGDSPTSAIANIAFIFDHFFLFIRQSVTDLLVTLLSPGQWNLPYYLSDFPIDRKPLMPFLMRGDLVGVWTELFGRGLAPNVILLALGIHTFVLYLGVGCGLWCIIRVWHTRSETQKLLLATMLLYILYFLGQLVFWEGSVRFRFPFFPYLAILSGFGYFAFWNLRTRKSVA